MLALNCSSIAGRAPFPSAESSGLPRSPVLRPTIQARMDGMSAGGRARCDVRGTRLVSLRCNGMRCSSLRFRRCAQPLVGVAYPEGEGVHMSVRSLLGLPPNNRVNRTAHQRRCACWWVPSSLRSSAAGYAERWASRLIVAIAEAIVRTSKRSYVR